ncbi:hydrocarbon-binding protein [Merismopedia glauca]|uniref:Hydrocarbon-binding protein n=1 Tax=Merismopedia glauca CCAP 1448/3 TaxID=1296344 RepID=A0A2T1BX59_9CYAN|nr:hydrocarbon-binding protein [Merismopedia glauca]PSB00497.1 hydrocarbon-binding protein [Merismopedia glauca CCAP 1448/3]
MQSTLRPELTDFNSIVCLKAIITGMEEALRDKATAISLVAAGRVRGKQLAESLGLAGASLSLEDLTNKVSQTLGKDGTRLLILDKIEQEGDNYKVYTRETVCSAGEPNGSPRQCTFTLGAVQGVLEAVTGKRFRGKQVASVLRGDTHDVFEYAPIG